MFQVYLVSIFSSLFLALGVASAEEQTFWLVETPSKISAATLEIGELKSCKEKSSTIYTKKCKASSSFSIEGSELGFKLTSYGLVRSERKGNVYDEIYLSGKTDVKGSQLSTGLTLRFKNDKLLWGQIVMAGNTFTLVPR